MGIESPIHLIFIAAVALIVLGPKRLPELARRLGQGVRELRDAMETGAEEDDTLAPHVLPPASAREPAQAPAQVPAGAEQPPAQVPAAAAEQPPAGAPPAPPVA